MPINSTVNAIPIMTSNTLPSGIASASTERNSTTSAYKAFDSNMSTYWSTLNSSDTDMILSYEFEEKKIIYKYKMTASNNSYAPKSWTFEGFDGVNWIVLDSRTVDSFVETNEHTIDNPKAYKKYKLDVSEKLSDNSYLWIHELSMYELILDKKLALKNPTTNQHYSLAEKTLIPLHDSSPKNMILHGIEAGKEIQLDEAFDKIKLIQDNSETLGKGKVFTHEINLKSLNFKTMKNLR